jgi:hypothetical protein
MYMQPICLNCGYLLRRCPNYAGPSPSGDSATVDEPVVVDLPSSNLDNRDASGNTVGHSVPTKLYDKMVSAWVRVQFADEQERDQARQEVRTQGGLTTAEAIAHLEQVAREARNGS